MASTAELTSDASTPPRSVSPSPPLPPTRYGPLAADKDGRLPASKAIIALPAKHELPAVAEVGEAAIEKTLGRKRCIMFACGDTATEKPKEVIPEPKVEPAQPLKRKCMLTFACPSRADKHQDLVSEVLMSGDSRKSSTDSAMSVADAKLPPVGEKPIPTQTILKLPEVVSPGFHEFGSSDEPDAWVYQPMEHKRKLTLNDCLMKENAIRQLGKEAEEEAEEEDREEEDLDNDVDEDDLNREDDFAPSDDSSDGGNESDDEEGFADSDDESDAGSEYLFWAPSTTTAATSTEHINITHISSRQRSTASSPESSSHMSHPLTRQLTLDSTRTGGHRRGPRVPRMRPGTPELPDSTDFVCGTLDEDRPLEAAYIACREQRKRERHIPIPQDIDPSFPTSDPEEIDDEDEDDMENGLDNNDEVQLSGIDDDKFRGRRGQTTAKGSPRHSPGRLRSPPPNFHRMKPEIARRVSHRSPPPMRKMARSPPPRRLFGHSPSRLRSPPPNVRLNSPRCSPTNRAIPLGLTINRLAQRPGMGRTSSLPHTPNPFFRNYRLKNRDSSNLVSGPITPGAEAETLKAEMHVRGPVDIVIGLEKKREKRKEKFWRQHCRKSAKEQAERKVVAGRGAERMKELGLGCAERNRGYGIGQPAELVISL
jgi:hypothetical protein